MLIRFSFETTFMRPTTVDAVIVDGERILLIKRGNEPFKGKWALPGGFVDSGETAEAACAREAKEETGVDVEVGEMVGVFSKPERDPERGTIAVAYLCRVSSGEVKSGDDAEEAKWFLLGSLPELAFDHGEILGAVKR